MRVLPLRIERTGKSDAHRKTVARSERSRHPPDLRRDGVGRERRSRGLLYPPKDPSVPDERGRDLVSADIHADGAHQAFLRLFITSNHTATMMMKPLMIS